MKKSYTTLRLIITVFIILSFTTTKTFAQFPADFFPQAGQTAEWKTDAFGNCNFIGSQPGGSPAYVATTFGGLVANDFTGLKLTFDAFVSSDGSKSNTVILSSNAVWGGQGIIIEINKFSIVGVKNFVYPGVDMSSGVLPATYQGYVRQDQYNAFIIDVDALGVITVTINGFVCPTTYAADIAVLQAAGSRFAVFSTAYSGYQMKNLKVEKGMTTKNYFTAEFNARFATTSTEWTIDGNNELNFNGTVPVNTPAIIETTFGGLTTPTLLTNEFRGLNLTFDAYISSDNTKNTSIVLSSNGIWDQPLAVSPLRRGILIAVNKDEVRGRSINAAAPGTLLSTNTAAYQAAVLTNAYNSFVVDVDAGGIIRVTINGILCATTIAGGGPLSATAPNPRYAVIGTDFTGFKLKNLTAVRGSTKTYFFNPLPVSLISFDAAKKANGSLLNWATASESNNSHFMVYKAADATNFKQIAKITAKNQAANYQYLDETPFAGINYYKLTQVDFDGTTATLGVKAVRFDLQTGNTVSIYPKPADKSINLSFSKTFESAITVKLFDLSGKEVQRATIAPQSEPINYVLDFDTKIVSGIYIMSISSGAYKHSERIIVK